MHQLRSQNANTSIYKYVFSLCKWILLSGKSIGTASTYTSSVYMFITNIVGPGWLNEIGSWIKVYVEAVPIDLPLSSIHLPSV
jgi:hypothetical protein